MSIRVDQVVDVVQLRSAVICLIAFKVVNSGKFCSAEQVHSYPPHQHNKASPFRGFAMQCVLRKETSVGYLNAFLCGGIICVVGQVLIDKTKLTPARILVSYVVIGVVASALGLYQPIVDFAGAGATVPLTGFGNSLAKGVRDSVLDDGFIGIFTGGLKATSGGIAAAIIVALLVSILFKAKDKS